MPFSHINLKPDPSLELMIAIKYGKPQPTEEWLATLPEPVLRAVARDVLTMFREPGQMGHTTYLQRLINSIRHATS